MSQWQDLLDLDASTPAVASTAKPSAEANGAADGQSDTPASVHTTKAARGGLTDLRLLPSMFLSVPVVACIRAARNFHCGRNFYQTQYPPEDIPSWRRSFFLVRCRAGPRTHGRGK